MIAVSIGFLYKKLPTIGVIYNPFLDQLYSALKGKGAFLNGNTPLPLHPPGPLPSLSSALMAVEYGSDRSKEIMELKARSFTRLAGDPQSGIEGGRMGHSLRSIGSAALNYSLVASGSLDIYWYASSLSGDAMGFIPFLISFPRGSGRLDAGVYTIHYFNLSPTSTHRFCRSWDVCVSRLSTFFATTAS